MAETVREWLVAGALVESDGRLLFVRNQRRGGSEDWSTPGGVIDADDGSLLDGLTREVEEETGLRVTRWEGPLYEVEAVAPDLGWVMRCEVHRALDFEGEVQVGGCLLDVGMIVLTSTRLGGKNRVAMNILEIAEGEFVPALAFGFFVILPEMPFPEFGEAVLLDEFVFSASGRLVVGPIASLVEHASPIRDQLLRVLISGRV